MATTATKKSAGDPKAPAQSKRTNGGRAKAPTAGPAQNGSAKANGKTVAEVLTNVNKTGQPRLGKGGLEALVAGHLGSHPKVEFTPTELGNKLNRSSGAIGNALERMAKAGAAVRTSDRPRRYKHKAAKAARTAKAAKKA